MARLHSESHDSNGITVSRRSAQHQNARGSNRGARRRTNEDGSGYHATVGGGLSEIVGGIAGIARRLTGRAEAQTVRLALLYALLDRAPQISQIHLEAALALWTYCEASARYVFGDLLGDPVVDTILRALRIAGPAGMSRTAIRDLFGRNQSGDRIAAALGKL